MSNEPFRVILMLFVLLSAGCLQAIDDTIEDVDDAIEQTIKALDGDYPQIALPERTRVSPELRFTMHATPCYRIYSRQYAKRHWSP